MTPERWDRIEELLGAVLELPERERTAFLSEQCGLDASLEAELQSLLAASALPEEGSPVAAVRAIVAAFESEYYLGRKLGSYTIESFLGRGAIGLVYRARESDPSRSVALKIFDSRAVSPGEQRQRMERECRAMEAMHHPNIVKILGLREAEGAQFLVMEFIEGETLARRLQKGALPPEAAVKVALQVASGLMAAHAAGIVHQDIKPANLMLGEHGHVTILDFGLSQSRFKDAGQEPVPTGVSIEGTIPYMSPEQIEGKQPDEQSDVFALGAVLQEMVTGQKAFSEATPAATMAAILHKAPAPVNGISARLARVIARCLEKDPRQRYQSAAELLNALQKVKRARPLVELSGGFRKVAVWAMASVGIAVAMGGIWSAAQRSASRGPHLVRLTDDSNLSIQPAISPDGKRIAYASDQAGDGGLDIWIQAIAGGLPQRLTTHEADDLDPSFSPDGRWIVFRSDRDGGGIYKVATSGGAVEFLAHGGRGPRYSPDGKWVVCWEGPEGPGDGPDAPARRLSLIPAGGGAARRIHADFATAHSAIWSPDGKALVFAGRQTGQKNTWWIADITGNQVREVQPANAGSPEGYRLSLGAMLPQCWLPGDRLVFQHFQGNRVTLMESPFSIREAKFAGPARRVAAGSEWQLNAACGTDGGVVFASARTELDIWSMKGSAWNGSLQRLTNPPASHIHPSFSPDGKVLLFASLTEGHTMVWRKELASGEERALTGLWDVGLWLRQSPDGKYFAWLEEQKRLHVVETGGGEVNVIEGVEQPWDLSSGAKYVVAGSGGEPHGIEVRMGNARAVRILAHPRKDLSFARLSPDERWIAFTAKGRGAKPEIHLAPFRGIEPVGEQEWVRGTSIEGSGAEWSRDGEWLYFFSEVDQNVCIWGQRLDKKRPIGTSQPMRHFHQFGRNLRNVPASRLSLAVAPDKVAFNLRTISSGLWMAH